MLLCDVIQALSPLHAKGGRKNGINQDQVSAARISYFLLCSRTLWQIENKSAAIAR